MKQLAIGFTLCMCCAAFAGGQKPNIQLAPRGQKMVPISYAGVTEINGQLVLTTGWFPYVEGSGSSDGSTAAQGDCVSATYSTCDLNNLIFDTFEPNLATGTPDDPDGSCTGSVPAGSRWYFGAAVNPPNPHALNDMCVCPGAAGTQAQGVDYSWFFGAGASRNMSVAILTNENFVADCSAAPSGGYNGVILNYGNNAGSAAGYYYSNINLCGSALFWQMPTDGCGGYEMRIGQAGATFVLDVTPGTQPMLWGDENQSPSAGFAANDIQWDDDTPRNGIFLAPTECYNYAYGLCPDPLGISLAFRALGGCNPCDTNHDGTINLGDIDPFVVLLNAGGHPTGCTGDTNGDGTINLGDIDPFVNCLNAP